MTKNSGAVHDSQETSILGDPHGPEHVRLPPARSQLDHIGEDLTQSRRGKERRTQADPTLVRRGKRSEAAARPNRSRLEPGSLGFRKAGRPRIVPDDASNLPTDATSPTPDVSNETPIPPELEQLLGELRLLTSHLPDVCPVCESRRPGTFTPPPDASRRTLVLEARRWIARGGCPNCPKERTPEEVQQDSVVKLSIEILWCLFVIIFVYIVLPEFFR